MHWESIEYVNNKVSDPLSCGFSESLSPTGATEREDQVLLPRADRAIAHETQRTNLQSSVSMSVHQIDAQLDSENLLNLGLPHDCQFSVSNEFVGG